MLTFTYSDYEWKEEDGGALVLYPIVISSGTQDESIGATEESELHSNDKSVEDLIYLDRVQEPSGIPSNKTIPQFNRLLLFTVIPGVSYHSI